MRFRPLAPFALALLLTGGPPVEAAGQAEAADPSRLYGRITTVDGRMYEGFIRWGGNEAGWFDILHANKRLPDRNRRDAERLGWESESERRIEIFGIGFSWGDRSGALSGSAQSGLRLGHISTLETVGSNRARLLLRSGEEIELESGGDVGSGVDEILVEDPRGGTVELAWRDLRSVDFIGGPGAPSSWGQRLYGTVRTRSGESLTGYIAWDMDELFTTDVLDGEESGRDREIPFSRIRTIARHSSSGAQVRLDTGEEVLLRGTNDVNDDNRDILVADPGFGEMRVDWDEFDRVEFTTPPARVELGVFDGAGRLRGTVVTRGGERVAGVIRWDNDEEYSWEILDGELRDGVQLDIEFGAIASIERISDRGSRVRLRDGRVYELTGSNDVNDDNKGLYVETDGGLVLVSWDRVERVTFER